MNTELKSKIPILLSAFVCPGAGQVIQKRYKACCIFMTGFLISFTWLMIAALKIIISFYKLALEVESYEVSRPNIMVLIPPFIIAVLFYLVNLFDVVTAQQRIRQKQQ